MPINSKLFLKIPKRCFDASMPESLMAPPWRSSIPLATLPMRERNANAVIKLIQVFIARAGGSVQQWTARFAHKSHVA